MQNCAQRKKVPISFELVLTVIDKICILEGELSRFFFYFLEILGHEASDSHCFSHCVKYARIWVFSDPSFPV